MYQKPKVIAEIGCNHKGDIGIAFELLDLAKECGANVKFQKEILKNYYLKSNIMLLILNPHNSYGETYGAHREFLEFDLQQNKQLMNYCKEDRN